MPSTLDSLLDFASVRGGGRLALFRDAAKALGENSPWPALRTLSDLGHLDILQEERGSSWSCSTPVLGTLPGRGGIAVACGARSSRLAELLAENLDFTVETQSGAPEIWLCRGTTDEFSNASAKIGIAVTTTPPANAISHVIPGISQGMSFAVRPIPSSKTPPSRWEPETGEWKEASMLNADGLWRLTDRYSGRRVLLLKAGGATAQTPDLGAGQAFACAQAGLPFMNYDRSTKTITLDGWRHLPLLHARALTLCSGLPPEHANGGVTKYHSVPEDIARLIRFKLQLEGLA